MGIELKDLKKKCDNIDKELENIKYGFDLSTNPENRVIFS